MRARRRLLPCSLLALGLWAAPAGLRAQSAAPSKPVPAAGARRGPGAAPAQKGPAVKAPPKGNPAKGGPRPGPNEAARRAIAGAPPADEAGKGVESPELKALRAAEQELFSAAAPAPGSPWPSDWSFPAPLDPSRPQLRASGLPPAPPRERAAGGAAAAEGAAWVRSLKLPALPVRWEPRLIKYLVFFRDDPRGRQLVQAGYRKSGRYAELIRAALRAEGVPDELIWVAMFESGFDPKARSPVGASGLWQFMPEGGRVYGLRVERWVDERLDPALATEAAAKYLSDLYRRFGSWELALAGYNMGHGGLSVAVRKYNTNDFWELSRFEAGLPWETTLYVPKIIAMAIAAQNPSVFGLDAIEPDPPARFDALKAKGGVSLEGLARAAGLSLASLEELNPQLRAGRTPPDPPDAPAPLAYPLRVPEGRGPLAAAAIDRAAAAEPRLARHAVRFGQTAESLASEYGISRSRLYELNAMAPGEALRAGDVVLLPAERPPSRPAPDAGPPVVAVPAHPAALPGRERVFYRVIVGDTLAGIAAALGVEADDLRSWNSVDPAARLHEGMVLQAFVPPGRDLSKIVVVREGEARPLVAGSDEFLAWSEAQRGKRRIQVKVARGDTWDSVSRRYGCSVGSLERINRRSRREALKPDEVLVVYTEHQGDEPPPSPRQASSPLGPPSAPRPDDLPPPPEPGAAAGRPSPAAP
ncbi:MAG TPA: transglycosylase SLT domain-containing protein [Polyangiaceae bacterium]|nr:transglycosylase SLT domain-containing protein [Polyangiaceae bacterium]